MKFLAALLVALASATAFAEGPQRFDLSYRFIYNGQPVGRVTDHFQRDGNRYRLTSEARPEGVMALLLPVLTLTSEGEIRSATFLPERYTQVRSNAPQRVVAAEFDWQGRQLIHHYKGRNERLTLPDGTQDALCQLYSFTLAGQAPAKLEFDVSNGRKLIHYRYEKIPAGRMKTPLGEFEVVEYRRITTAPDDNAISVWIAPALHHLPLRIRVREESGLFEQHLVRFDYQAS